MKTDYEPYGKQWETEMMKMRKADIIEMFRLYATQEQGEGEYPADEKEAVRQLGGTIGYGNMMHLASDCWRELMEEIGSPISGVFVPVLPCDVKPSTPPTEPAQSEDELLDNIVKIVKSAWTPDSEPTPPANKKD